MWNQESARLFQIRPADWPKQIFDSDFAFMLSLLCKIRHRIFSHLTILWIPSQYSVFKHRSALNLECHRSLQLASKESRNTKPFSACVMYMMAERQSAVTRRSKMEVKIDIMQAIAEGAGRPTHIMYRSNLSWAVMRSFIKLLESQGLVHSGQVDGKKSYLLTEKGNRVLQTYTSVKSQLESLAPRIAAPEPMKL